MIEIRELVKTFDGFAALDGASLTVPQGAIYGLVGPNGAGKSTLLRHLTGVYRQDSGTVSVDGADVWENVAVKQRIASIPDDWHYFMQSSIRDMMKFYRGFYPQFNMERYEKLRGVFSLDEKQQSAVFPRECRSRRRSGSPCAVCRTISFWMSRWTASTP